MDTESILDLFGRAVAQGKIRISLHATEKALAEVITRPEIESVMLDA